MARNYTLKPQGRGAEDHAIDFAAELNEQQYAAVTSRPGHALVIAGAGSGKTRTLIYRVAFLLANGIPAENILLLTFTNKAAREMLDRVEKLLPMKTHRLWGGTFHSIGNRILRRHADLLGYRGGFSIMDREDQKDLVATAVQAAGVDTKSIRFPKPEVLGNLFSLATSTGAELEEILAARYPYFEHLDEEIGRIRDAYEARKLETNSMDFDDLLVRTVELLEKHGELREDYRHRFQFVLVDEYQDTNAVQSELIDMLVGDGGNLMVVGDDAQSIYSWRGADFQNILGFAERYPGAQVFKIETNYRSVPDILSLANQSILGNEHQFRKELRPSRESCGMLPALVATGDTNQQAAFVAQRILELRDEGIEFDEIAVLYRAHYQSMEVQMEFSSRGIPFRVTSGLRFFEQAHIKDIAAFIRFAVNGRDELAFKRVVKLIPGVGDVAATKLWAAWKREDTQLEGQVPETFSSVMLGFPVPSRARKTWEQFVYTWDELLDGQAGFARPTEMITSVVEGVYDEVMRSRFQNYENRRQDVEQLAAYAGQFDDVAQFLTQLSLMSAVDDQPSNEEPDDEVVTLSTVHQAKGLEWRAVFVIWLADGMFPSARTLDEGSDEGLEEERRLFYVAVTRAGEELYLTWPRMWYGSHDGEVLQRPSRFLEELPSELMEEWNVGGAQGWY
jgi:DNA helicase-2/ATP-dependent DNA helicase PcrA